MGQTKTIANPAFKDAFQRRRYIVPATGFIEWQTIGKKIQPYHFRRRDNLPLSLAGLWVRWSRGSEPVEAFTIVVTHANDLVRPMHDRMPVVLSDKDIDHWLDPEEPPEILKEMLHPAEDRLLVGERANTRVNNVKNDDPDCLIAEELPRDLLEESS